MKKTLLCILDGWGIGKKDDGNAIHLAETKNFEHLSHKFSGIEISASEKQVGLPEGQFGNSEVGHMNIGAGRVLLQDILRINKLFGENKIEKNNLIQDIIKQCRRIHLMGILSDGGVHGHQEHLFKLMEIFDNKENEILLHCFLDGRDSSPISGKDNLKILQEKIGNRNNIKLASLCGRFFSMDRDNRWDRINLAYKAIIEGSSSQCSDFIKEINESYKNEITDEFFEPRNFNNYSGIMENDGFFITNFRADRVRELLTSIFDKNFDFFERRKIASFYKPLSMVEYSKRIRKLVAPIIESTDVKNNLGEVLSDNGLKQLRIAETEKYAHVTYFFNGGKEEKYCGEDRIVIPSPRVETYDLVPEMSAFKLMSELSKKLETEKYDFIVTNFANADMVGHTGNKKATIKAIEAVDECLGQLYEDCKKNGYTLVVTADHGNADCMTTNNEKMGCTTHSINPVPFIVCDNVKYKKMNGCLADIAPTILKIMDVKQPPEMTGVPLIE